MVDNFNYKCETYTTKYGLVLKSKTCILLNIDNDLDQSSLQSNNTHNEDEHMNISINS